MAEIVHLRSFVGQCAPEHASFVGRFGLPGHVRPSLPGLIGSRGGSVPSPGSIPAPDVWYSLA